MKRPASLSLLLALCAATSAGCFSTLHAPPAATAAVRARLAASAAVPDAPHSVGPGSASPHSVTPGSAAPPTSGTAHVASRGFDDSDWREVLARFVDDQGRVDYAALAGQRAALDRFVALLAMTGPETTPELFTTEDDRLAYYLNAYNALVIFSVLEHPGLVSVNDHKVDFFYLTCFVLDGADVNLYDLENDVVRARFRRPEVHMALNCASVSCPELPREPFTGPLLKAQLAARTTRFLHAPANVTTEDGVLVLSEIFDWFSGDFPPDAATWIARQVPDLGLAPGLPVRFRPWDWRLNASAGH